MSFPGRKRSRDFSPRWQSSPCSSLAQIILPARRVTGYVVDEKTGEPRSYRLNGLLVFVIAVIVWATEITGMPRDWFYRSSVYAVAGGTVFTAIFAAWAVFSQPQGDVKNPLLALWFGRAREISLFKNRFDIKMYFYVVGGSMLSLNALSGAAYHYDRFGDDFNPGVFLYAGFFTFYILDYFIFERVQLYTYDLIHEKLGFMLFWGGLVVYGWLFILPLWGMAAHPDPGFSTAWTYVWLIGAAGAVPHADGSYLAGPTYRSTPSSDGRTASSWDSSSPSTSRPATARSYTQVFGAWPATSTTWAKGSSPSLLAWCSATS